MILYNPTVSGSLLITGSLTTTGTLTAQTLVVQTITSSVDFVTGSSVNGSLSSNTHQFTGSVSITGSAAALLNINNGVLYVSASGNVGIGTISPVKTLEVRGTLAISNSPTSYWYMDRDDSDGRFKIVTDTDSEKFAITNAGNVGIGTITSTVNSLQKYLSITDNYNVGIILNDTRAASAYELFMAGSVFYINYGTSNKFNITSTGAATFSSGIGIGGATATTGGIQFPATAVAIADGNNLDDYEEGTCSLAVTFGGASVGVTYTTNIATYTKIGRQVTVNGFIILTSKGSSTGDVAITGLPFTVGPDNQNFSAVALRFANITFANQFQGFARNATTQIEFEEITEAGSATRMTNTDFANNSNFMLSLTYFV